ncbi:MAG TPA: GNAT family N-acetyltransferase [Chitinophagaceae bacterium]
MAFTFQPLGPATWNDFVELFGDKGACGGCWCMTWRLKAADYEKQKGEGNKKAMQQLVKKKKPLGILAFGENKAVGWCAVAPGSEYIRLKTSRVLKPVDDQPVWIVSCFFIQKNFRNKGLSTLLLKAAIDFAISKGANIIEGYPIDPKPPPVGEVRRELPDVFAWTGLSSTFKKAGFSEVTRRSETRPIMRIYKN